MCVRERETVHVCIMTVCVRERERVCVCARERETACEQCAYVRERETVCNMNMCL